MLNEGRGTRNRRALQYHDIWSLETTSRSLPTFFVDVATIRAAAVPTKVECQHGGGCCSARDLENVPRLPGSIC